MVWQLLLIFFSGLILSSGCVSSRSAQEALQARLRWQEQQLESLREQLRHKDEELAEARREQDYLREQLAARDGDAPTAVDGAHLMARLAGIKIHPLLTTSVNRDDQPGNESLMVQFYPHDEDGEVLKLPGAIQISVLDPDNHRVVEEWTIPREQARRHWTRGFLGTGYRMTLPWKNGAPPHRELVLHVRFLPGGDREYTATEIIRLRSAKGGVEKLHESRKPERLMSSEESPASPTQQTEEASRWGIDDLPIWR
ncbi:MAG: hypothetical protein KatS3mg113_0592 [Planctomycetaceae bacterium]|nr:MAG: hypothetical protein KatS3mg113_0592 [Planctomycetaceae bacterium]